MLSRLIPLPSLSLRALVIGLWLLVNISLLYGSYLLWDVRRDELKRTASHAVSDVGHVLSETLNFAQQELHRLHYDIRLSAGELEPIRLLLASQANRGRGLLRFAWVDAQDQMRVSSSGGIRSDPYDLSDRDYIRQARLRPFTTIISPLLTHTITRKPIIVLALGIEAQGGRYLGTLNAILHQDVLVPFIENQMKQCRCWYRVLSPHGELLVQSKQAPDSPAPPRANPALASAFHVQGGASEQEQQAIVVGTLLVAALMLCVFNSASLFGWYVIRRRLLHPLGQQLRDLPVILSPEKPHADEVERQLQRINQLGLSYVALSQQLKDTQGNLGKTRQLLMQLGDDRSRLAAATSHELQRSFDAIHSYASLLEDLIAAQMLNPEHRYYYDDVVEMGENLMRLSQGLQLLHRPAHPRPQAVTPWPLLPMMEQCLQRLMPSAERRNIALSLKGTPHAISQSERERLEMAVLCLMVEAIRSCQDEAELVLDYQADGQASVITLQASHGRADLVSLDARDFGTLLPSLAQQQQQEKLIAAMQTQANLVMATSLAAAMQASLRLSPYLTHGFSIQLIVPHHP